MKRILILIALVVAQSIPAVAESREKDLDRWVDRDLIPYVRQQLVVHPRFKSETVMFVVLNDNKPASSTNALALSMRDRLLAAAVATPGIEIGWHQGRSRTAAASGADECVHDDVHYYIGVELTQKLDGTYAVSVRALDLEDRTWVTGFGRRWQGKLSTSQRQAMRQERVDETFLGARDVPFTLGQTDLLAAHLAHELSCALHKRIGDDYVVSVDLVEPPASGLEGTVELISNNLANRRALKLRAGSGAANAILSGKAHQISGALHQYWVTVTPNGEADGVSALSASAYILLPAATDTSVVRRQLPMRPAERSTSAHPARPAALPLSIPNAGADGFIGPLSIAPPRSLAECQSGPCSLLQTEARVDSIVFFLQHQASHGLVRLGDAECRDRTAAHVARRGEAVRLPITRTSTGAHNMAETLEWELAPDLDTYYAVVATDARVARKIANHMDRLPMRCTDSLRAGFEDEQLQDWLEELAAVTATHARHVDWRAVEVRNVL
jgi:hypothetical protein